MSFAAYSRKSRTLIEENIKEFLSNKKGEIPERFRKQRAVESLEDFLLKGKLIRGTLYLLTIELFGEKISQKHIDIACAIELVHSALLIQDDVIDNDRLRRGGKTVFVQYEEVGKLIGANDNRHYGESMAIIVADVAFFLALELFARYPGQNIQKLLSFYSNEIYLVALAQGVDTEFGQTEEDPKREDINAVYKYKTARYTFSLPFVLAAIATERDEKVIEVLEKIGEYAGLIFQMKDDLLGIIGEEETIGKPVGSDIRENKKTLVRHLLFEKAEYEEKKYLASVFGNPSVDMDDVVKVRSLIEKYGIETILNQDIEKIMMKVWKLFAKVEGNSEYKEILRDLFEYNINRKT